MEKFDPSDEGSLKENRGPSERLAAFTKTLLERLVPDCGSCVSAQGELIRAKHRLESELLRNGMANYFDRDEPTSSLGDNYYGELLLFLLDTMAANANQALSDEDVAYFAEIRREVEPQWLLGLRSNELNCKADEEELSGPEQEELAQLEAQPSGPDWEDLFHRAERCIANWCLTNTALIGRDGNRVTEGGVSDVVHLFEAPPRCLLCNGKGWLAAPNPADFPTVCACKK
jgi:hypothetical protein